jgi:hypothetical protein
VNYPGGGVVEAAGERGVAGISGDDFDEPVAGELVEQTDHVGEVDRG